MAGIIEGFRWTVTGVGRPPGIEFAASMAVVVLLLLLGLRRFWRTESTFADVI
jgi:lipopolysaccharide transport system permease protein